MIDVSDLIKYYGDKQILHNLHFTVGSGKICGFLGPNGSGKSTTMDILAGLLGPSSGSARICGFDVVTQAKDVKACTGYLPDAPPLYKDMLVEDFISYAAKLRGIHSQALKQHVNQIMEECDVIDVKDRLIANLSKGYRQRVALCAALVHKPKVLILDEPTEGLDPTQILHIRNLIKKLSQERTVILSSHILSEVQATCNEAIIINKGYISKKISLEASQHLASSYVYTFVSQTAEALSWFQGKSFVASSSLYAQKENSVVVEFQQEFLASQQAKEELAKITMQIVEQKLPLIGMQEKKNDLEEIFFEVIRTQNDKNSLSLN